MRQQEEAEQIISYREWDRLPKNGDQDGSQMSVDGCAILPHEHSAKVEGKRGILACQTHHRRAFLIGIVAVSLILLFMAVIHSHSRPSVSNVEQIKSLNPPQKQPLEPIIQSPQVITPSPAIKPDISLHKDKEKQNSIAVQNEKNQKKEMQTDNDAPRPDWQMKQMKQPKKDQDKLNPVGLYIANPAVIQPRVELVKRENNPANQQMQIRRNELYQKQKAIRQERARLKAEKEQKENILKDVLKNPFLNETYANITESDLIRVRKWRYIVNISPDAPSPVTQQEKQYYQTKYQVSKYEELPFCIVVPTFNNKARKRYYRNIKSILMQDYTNYKVIVIDDASTDGTGAAIESVLNSQSKMKSSQYKVIIQKERHFAMPNLRYAAKNFCSPRDIFMIVDGDDELLGKQVLKLFNAVFQKEGVWFAYSNFLGSNSKLGYSRPFHPSIIENNEYRKYSFAVSHLRAYYTQLFLNIDEKDLQDDKGNYLTSANDMAICIPALQQAHTRIAYIPELTYFYNFNTGLNVHKARLQEQRQNNLRIREKKSYQPLEKLFPE